MALDLSALEDKPTVEGATEAPSGKPLELLLSDIEEDPNQPRKEFTEAAMVEMTDSIKARGVRQPVSVRPHPTKPGKWMLNFGARRFRGSLAAGKETIPAFVDESSDDFDQVIENEQRDNLKPMELALFIGRKLDEGIKKAEIARKLGKAPQVITEHLALINPPTCIEEIYRDGKCTSPKTLYDLRGLHDKFPESVEEWCATAEDVTRKAVAELATELKGGRKLPPSPSETGGTGTTGESETFRHDEENPSPTEPDNKSESGSGEDGEGGESETTKLPYHNPENEKDTKEPSIPDPNKIKKPLLLVYYDGREAMVLLNRKPSTPGLIWIRYEDGSGDEEVSGTNCKINLLSESVQ
jgi:ParB family chromosome partitioning protein